MAQLVVQRRLQLPGDILHVLPEQLAGEEPRVIRSVVMDGLEQRSQIGRSPSFDERRAEAAVEVLQRAAEGTGRMEIFAQQRAPRTRVGAEQKGAVRSPAPRSEVTGGGDQVVGGRAQGRAPRLAINVVDECVAKCVRRSSATAGKAA